MPRFPGTDGQPQISSVQQGRPLKGIIDSAMFNMSFSHDSHDFVLIILILDFHRILWMGYLSEAALSHSAVNHAVLTPRVTAFPACPCLSRVRRLAMGVVIAGVATNPVHSCGALL